MGKVKGERKNETKRCRKKKVETREVCMFHLLKEQGTVCHACRDDTLCQILEEWGQLYLNANMNHSNDQHGMNTQRAWY